MAEQEERGEAIALVEGGVYVHSSSQAAQGVAYLWQ